MRPTAVLLAALLLSPLPALAEGGGGDRAPAGGAFLSSYGGGGSYARGTPSAIAPQGVFAEPEATAAAPVRPQARASRRVRR